MGQQQLGFDFFDNDSQPEIPAKVPVPAKKTDASSKSGIPKVPDNITVEEPIPEILVDDTIREVEFIVAEPQPEIAVLVSKKTTERKSTRGRMKLADMDVLVDLVEVPEDEVLFQKRYYGIGEVSNMFKVNISLIRFWENEFDILKPKKNGKGDRLFRPEDVKSLQLIYHLLREKKYSIAGAKDFLKKNKKNEEAFAMIETLKKTKAFLLELKANL